MNPHPIVIAHRGCWRLTSENSLSGLRACAAHGIDMVEVDVRETRDGVLVLMHDDTLERTTDIAGRTEDLTLAQLKLSRLRRGAGGIDAPVTDEAPPTFVEELRAAKGSVILYMDIKEDSIYDRVVRTIEREHAQDWVVFPTNKSGYAKLPVWARRRSMPVAIDCSTGIKDCYSALGQAVVDYRPLHPISIAVLFENDSYVLEARSSIARLGVRLCAWSVSNPGWDGARVESDSSVQADAKWGALLRMGFSIIETNDPISLEEYLRSG